ncbi:hypothetical protein PP754_gp088 [Pectobacterium phage Possum]|uniref:Uncharacterized protein n=1 Tax=Pectobacterium phage Possum TaxID=2686301 RepID=A0A7T0Q292_9CAUD|nr:hypothetical protein PP754_gp088 [Pectobacterium phage Possum]QPL10929.1 hypothetical protein Possum_00088 [Pectobacterium phage Possum]QPL11031.1 putative DNA-packaging protein FI [Pectobacterium phage Horatius]
MSEVDEVLNHDDDLPQQDERAALEARARILNINFHTNISTDKLRERVNAAIQGTAPEAETERPAKGESDVARRSRLKKEASKLVRIRIHCNDPAKKDWPGEYITVGNNAVGTYRKYVPYNQDEPTHIPQIMFNALREKRVQVFATKKGKNGIPIREAKSIAAYSIEVLQPLTQEELDELARSQVARNALSDNA